jgi:antiviral helicase SLH1
MFSAPMKALASEIVRKFDKRLKWLGINVRELTGTSRLEKLTDAGHSCRFR